MAANAPTAQTIAAPDGSNLKDYWQTEASANGPEAPGDALQAREFGDAFFERYEPSRDPLDSFYRI